MSISDSARKIPGVAAAEGAIAGAMATEEDLPIAGYYDRTADDIASRLNGFSQRELRTIDAYERKRGNRATITDRVAKLLGEQPWAGDDEQDASTRRRQAQLGRQRHRPPRQALRARPQRPRRSHPGRGQAPRAPRSSHHERFQEEVVQYLDEAHAHERALVSVLMSQIAMTPRGSYRTALETHLRETRDHADRVGRRRRRSAAAPDPLGSVLGAAETVVGQVLALGKTPIDMFRGSGGEEKVLKNAKDACATEALEIATYTAIERLARVVGDTETADLAASIRADEEKMLERITRSCPSSPTPSSAPTSRAITPSTSRRRAPPTRRAAAGRRPRRAQDDRLGQAPVAPGPQGPGRRPHRGTVKGAVASEGDLAISRYDSLTVEEINGRLAPLADRPREGRRLRAQAPEPHHGDRAHLDPAGRRAVGRLRRADRRRGAGRPGRGRRGPHQAGPRLRARPQEPRRRPRGRRARAHHRLTRTRSGRRLETAVSGLRPAVGCFART